jgi:cytochrome P450
VTASELDFYGRPLAPHVPRELVRRIDVFDGPGMDRDPFAAIRALRSEPPLVYNLHNPFKGQSWLPTRAELIRSVAGNPELFSNVDQLGFAALIGETWKYGPLEMDAPDHTNFRKLMNPWLSPPAVARLSDKVRQRAVELIEAVADKGGCEFVSAFGTPYPVSIFMEMMGLPEQRMPDFLKWVSQLLHTGDPQVKMQGVHSITTYLRGLIADRRNAPQDDLASRVVSSQIDGKPLSEDDLLGVCYLLFTGGLDTVASSSGFFFRHLATHPEHQERLRRNPEDIPKAVDELLRAYTPTQALRMAKQDTELAGVSIKKGDWINLVFSLAGLDPHEFENPDQIDFDRPNNRHFAFSYGPHFCAGSHLAKRELQIALTEWMQRIPPFRLAPGEEPKTHGGQVFGVDRLVLEW